MNTQRKKILIRCPNWLGDIVMSIPAINAVKNAYPDHAVFGYVRTEYADILKRVKGIDEILKFRKKNFFSELKMVPAIKTLAFQKAFIFPNSWTSALIPYCSAIPEIYGYDVRGRALFFKRSIKISEEVEKRHQVYHYLDLISKVKTGDYDDFPHLTVVEEEINEFSKKNGLAGKKICAFFPAAAYGEAKCWFKERYAELGRILTGLGFYVLIIGSESDIERCGYIADGIGPEARNFAGKVNLYELPVLLRLCRFLVSNDSGPMHVAAAVNTPVVSIFGSTNPRNTYPFGYKHLVIHNELDCSYCLERECKRKDKHMLCMELITVVDVFEKLALEGLV